jgi:hypothetical protein
MSINIAFCLTAAGVRFIVREIVLTGVLFFECFFSSRISTEVHARRLVLAIFISPPLIAARHAQELGGPLRAEPASRGGLFLGLANQSYTTGHPMKPRVTLRKALEDLE